MEWPLKGDTCTLKFPIDSAKSSVGISEKLQAVLSKKKLLQLFFINLRVQKIEIFTNFKMKILKANFFSLSINLAKTSTYQNFHKLALNLFC